jgi:uncharacterized Fe-S cluster-containing radical SAM superfamily protein
MRRAEEVVCRGEARRHTNFYSTGVYGGIATGSAVGCCLRCVFWWVDDSRGFPETHGELYTPEKEDLEEMQREIAKELKKVNWEIKELQRE